MTGAVEREARWEAAVTVNITLAIPGCLPATIGSEKLSVLRSVYSLAPRESPRMFGEISRWIGYRRELRRRWQEDARRLLLAEEANAYYEAQRRATRSRVRHDRPGFYHWAKVAAEVARLSPEVEMNIATLRAIVSEEERRSR